jgi:hypothetical protein
MSASSTTAPVLEAQVLEADIATVASERGETISHVRMKLKVGGKRNLETRLPDGARIWSLLVNGRSTSPSEKAEAQGGRVLLIPLPQTPTGELIADLDFVYVAAVGRPLAAGQQQFVGPRFDLPLKNLTWRFYLPEECDYGAFGGTLAVNEAVLGRQEIHRYNVSRYEEEVTAANKAQEAKVDFFQDQGKVLARDGRQYEARYALENAYNYSFADPARNEDARVQLHNLIRGQAMVGLVGRRGYLRPRAGQEGEPGARGKPVEDLGDSFNQADAERLRNSLSKADSENLERITRSVIEAQEAAAGSGVQIAVSMPLRGKIVEFDRPVQVKPNSEMVVTFEARPAAAAGSRREWAALGGLFAALLCAMLIWPLAGRKWDALRGRLKAAEAAESEAGQAAMPGDNAAGADRPEDQPPAGSEQI